MPFTAQKNIFKRLAELADTRCMSKEEQEKYDESRKAADDYYSGLYGSFLSGLEEGEAKGEARGEAKGRAKEKKAIALSLLAQNVSAEIIAQATGLSIEDIKKL